MTPRPQDSEKGQAGASKDIPDRLKSDSNENSGGTEKSAYAAHIDASSQPPSDNIDVNCAQLSRTFEFPGSSHRHVPCFPTPALRMREQRGWTALTSLSTPKARVPRRDIQAQSGSRLPLSAHRSAAATTCWIPWMQREEGRGRAAASLTIVRGRHHRGPSRLARPTRSQSCAKHGHGREPEMEPTQDVPMLRYPDKKGCRATACMCAAWASNRRKTSCRGTTEGQRWRPCSPAGWHVCGGAPLACVDDATMTIPRTQGQSSGQTNPKPSRSQRPYPVPAAVCAWSAGAAACVRSRTIPTGTSSPGQRRPRPSCPRACTGAGSAGHAVPLLQYVADSAPVRSPTSPSIHKTPKSHFAPLPVHRRRALPSPKSCHVTCHNAPSSSRHCSPAVGSTRPRLSSLPLTSTHDRPSIVESVLAVVVSSERVAAFGAFCARKDDSGGLSRLWDLPPARWCIMGAGTAASPRSSLPGPRNDARLATYTTLGRPDRRPSTMALTSSCVSSPRRVYHFASRASCPRLLIAAAFKFAPHE
uniref:Uncharacterized protein n=1 Tax=Mycena chlorophos TaxID=658473 RepID=A0ABQ0LXR9_MYCCL|nr:predicted protein [Mycena chlorophos]